ncbi:MAG: hypothetical protein QXG00_06790 [Candidatus Woesearchaeota archaeon]
MLLSQLHDKFKIDEYYNHYPTVLAIYNDGLIKTLKSDNYKAANTPLPYLLSLVPYKISGKAPDIKSLRAFNSLIALLCLLVISYFTKYIHNENNFIHLGVVFFYPYFLKPAFTYYLSIYGLLFFFITLYVVKIQSETILKWFWVGLSVAAAILSQQFYLVLIPAILLHIIFFDESDIKSKVLKSFIFIVTSLLLTLPIFIIWNGLTHPNYTFHQINLDFTKFTSIFLISGSILFFYFLSVIKNLDKKVFAIFLAVSFLLNTFLYPEFSIKGGYEKITGYTFHFIHIIENFNYVLSFLVRFFLVSIGLYGVYDLINKMVTQKDFILSLILILIIVGFMFNELLAERHLLPLVVLLILYSSFQIKSKHLLNLWFFFQVILGSGYFIYYLFYQTNY